MNYNNSIAQVTPVCYCYLCVSILRALNEIKIPIWRQTITYFEQLGLLVGGFSLKHISKTIVIHYCQHAAAIKYFVKLQSFTKIREANLLYKRWFHGSFEKKTKAHNFTKKQKNSAKIMMLLFAFCFIFTKKGWKLKRVWVLVNFTEK